MRDGTKVLKSLSERPMGVRQAAEEGQQSAVGNQQLAVGPALCYRWVCGDWERFQKANRRRL